MDFDYDIYLDCGCVVAWDHGDWSWDITRTDECTEMHTVAQAIQIASKTS